ncbi:hypothetical protein ACRYCC_15325 [Actinomadura scrupuli]|uniref:hypothetical protein n=1 Tax=Actinomadura scrupuli TaxID=559629 RepID=UPI003D96B1BF
MGDQELGGRHPQVFFDVGSQPLIAEQFEERCALGAVGVEYAGGVLPVQVEFDPVSLEDLSFQPFGAFSIARL